MSMSQQQSLTSHVVHFDLGAHVMSASFWGDDVVMALADGTYVLRHGDEMTRSKAHEEGCILVAQADDQRLVSGGDDGRVVEMRRGQAPSVIADEKGKWIDALALRDDGAIAWSCGRNVRARDAKGDVREMSAPSSVRGLAFMPKGYRIVMTHYNGVSLWLPNIKGEPEALVWRGSHLDVTVSPDGKFIITAMQEHALHGWRVADKKDMRMTGYPSKTRSFSWSSDGKWLATSGAEACIVWPFQTKDGPMGKGPRECGVRPAHVARVAFHPHAGIVALGYNDGWVMMCRLGDAAEILIHAPAIDDGAPITALAWDEKGQKLIFADEAGRAGLLTLPHA
jgi:WD40 repeat protein